MSDLITKTVERVEGQESWTNEHGTYYPFLYIFDDGSKCRANHIKNEPWPVGSKVDVEVNGTDKYGNSSGKVRKHNPDGGYKEKPTKGGGGFDEDRSLYQSCINGVMDNMTARGMFDQFTSENINKLALEIAQGAKANIQILKGNG